mgnify:CR=1 FL=1
MSGEAVNDASGNKCNIAVEGNFLALREDMCLLDPGSNSPLKIYTVNKDDIKTAMCDSKNLTAKFPLRMNKMEKHVESRKGTVLVLGRSGTGKRIARCILYRH